MILECPNCETRYEIPVELPPEGRKVRCAACKHVWTATGQAGPPPAISLPDFEDEEIVFKEGETPEQPDGAAPEPAEAGSAGAGGETIEDDLAPEAAEAGDDEPPPGTMETGEEGAEEPPIVIGKARKVGPRLPGSLAAGWAALVLVVAGVAAVAYFQRVGVVRALPGAAAVYERIGLPVNVRGLAFEGVKYSWETSAGRPVLEVYGDIVNITAEPLKVPTVVFGLRTKERVEVYQWAADVRTDLLPPGERTAFTAQIPTPPKSIRDVQVRFAKVR